jgi:hypothetical protein
MTIYVEGDRNNVKGIDADGANGKRCNLGL